MNLETLILFYPGLGLSSLRRTCWRTNSTQSFSTMAAKPITQSITSILYSIMPLLNRHHNCMYSSSILPLVFLGLDSTTTFKASCCFSFSSQGSPRWGTNTGGATLDSHCNWIVLEMEDLEALGQKPHRQRR